jgi:nitric oxide reductase subunit C
MNADPITPASRWREIILALVVACGLTQTLLVYADPGGPETERLSAEASRGQALWRRHNCHVCHQLHGFGGFLGPDLTNVASRYTRNELSTVLERGRNRMPAFDFSRRQQAGLWAFFQALDRSGLSQPHGIRDRRPQDEKEHWQRLTLATEKHFPQPLPDVVKRGARLVTEWNCGSCHLPLERGRFQAPDLALAAGIRPRAELAAIIRDGRNTMPGFSLSDADLIALLDYLAWMNIWRDLLVETNDKLCVREPFDFGEVPWFEYR